METPGKQLPRASALSLPLIRAETHAKEPALRQPLKSHQTSTLHTDFFVPFARPPKPPVHIIVSQCPQHTRPALAPGSHQPLRHRP